MLHQQGRTKAKNSKRKTKSKVHDVPSPVLLKIGQVFCTQQYVVNNRRKERKETQTCLIYVLLMYRLIFFNYKASLMWGSLHNLFPHSSDCVIANTCLIDLYPTSAVGLCLIYKLEKLSARSSISSEAFAIPPPPALCISHSKLYYPPPPSLQNCLWYGMDIFCKFHITHYNWVLANLTLGDYNLAMGTTCIFRDIILLRYYV